MEDKIKHKRCKIDKKKIIEIKLVFNFSSLFLDFLLECRKIHISTIKIKFKRI